VSEERKGKCGEKGKKRERPEEKDRGEEEEKESLAPPLVGKVPTSQSS